MLLTLGFKDFKYIVEDIEFTKYGNEPLIVFKKEFNLFDIYGRKKKETIYIKIKIKNDNLPIISFHLDE